MDFNDKYFALDWGRGVIAETGEYGGVNFWFVYNDIFVSFKNHRTDKGIYSPLFTFGIDFFDVPEIIRKTLQTTYNKNKVLLDLYSEVALRGNTPEWDYSKSDLEELSTFELNESEINNVEKLLIKYTYIYLIKDLDTGLIKIGRSSNPTNRLKTLIKQDTLLPTANNFILLKAWHANEVVEKTLHDYCSASRVRGEWFELTETQLGFIDSYMSNFQPWGS